uniref:Vomeronasal type-1 receptor n=1 Tax=Nannospalax galili TaxID=1026970 RepID=A0A4Y1N3X2_NANGA|nr:vomeronasal type 1 receptor 4 [Nannospalax galili]AWV49403.1 vomeronasal type 1 receptor 4 [Nannospalax galili]AWV49405.1 vomeronasal type 1 receptor 4 [Nannospalax galili]AWV49407.1 vomeronasal type 1 receptor 4 [Nannospalax galili]AWV49409.1 vomeronasal type 1 receptor 4 [Nannospalax galili]
MVLRKLVTGILLILQTIVGIVGNFSLLFHYLVVYYNKFTLKPKDLILVHLIIANSMIIVSKGIPCIMGVLELKQFFSDFGCKLLLYTQRVGRSMSIGTACHPSVFQAITISPGNSCWKNFQIKAKTYIDHSMCLCWVLHMTVHFIFPVYARFKGNSNNMTEKWDFEFCSFVGRDKIVDTLYAALSVFPEVVFSMIMAWSSGSMVVILYRHKQRVQSIRSSHASHRTCPESRATQSILVLVFIFLTFYTLSSILQGCIAVSSNPSWWLLNITAVMSMCFPTLSPFVLNPNSTVIPFCFAWMRNKKFP